MSQENVELLRRGFEHVERTGEFLPDAAHPDLVWDTTTFQRGMRPERCVGVDEANRWLAQWLEDFEDWSVEIEELHDGGDRVVTIARQRARPRHGGPEVEMHVAQVWTFRDGLVARMEIYADRDEALRAVGLSR
jgi:ketosteroid isomerase-like protein